MGGWGEQNCNEIGYELVLYTLSNGNISHSLLAELLMAWSASQARLFSRCVLTPKNIVYNKKNPTINHTEELSGSIVFNICLGLLLSYMAVQYA